MDRRTFLGAATAAAITNGLHPLSLSAQAHSAKLKPMELGLLISPHDDPEGAIKRVHDMGFSNCFLSLDGYINQFTADAAKEIGDLLAKYQVVATTVEVVGIWSHFVWADAPGHPTTAKHGHRSWGKLTPD